MTIQRWSKDVKYACRVLSYMIPFAVLPNLDENEENVEIRRLVVFYMNILQSNILQIILVLYLQLQEIILVVRLECMDIMKKQILKNIIKVR